VAHKHVAICAEGHDARKKPSPEFVAKDLYVAVANCGDDGIGRS
jgi:hypothetical protein